MEKQTKSVILTSYYKPKPGGLCKRYFRAINALLDRGHIVHYLSVEPFPIEHPNCIHHRFLWPKSKADGLVFWAVFYLLAPLYLCKISLKHKPQHTFSFHPSYALLLKMGTVFQNITTTIFFRADSIENHRFKKRQNWITRIDSIIEGLAIRHSKLVFISKACQTSVLKRHANIQIQQTSVLYNDIRSSIPPKKTIHPQEIIFSSVGILETRKNQALILEALREVEHSTYKYKYNIYGIGEDDFKLKQLIIKYKLQDTVTLLGWCEREHIWEHTDVLLLPSLHEGVSNSLLEAIERRIPVLASDIPEHREILQEESLINLAPNSWAKIITKILDAPNTLNDISKQQQISTEFLKFEWDKTTSDHILQIR